jgi:hypothetical protein
LALWNIRNPKWKRGSGTSFPFTCSNNNVILHIFHTNRCYFWTISV